MNSGGRFLLAGFLKQKRYRFALKTVAFET